MTRQDLYRLLTDSFGFMPTEGQRTVLYHLAAFLLSEKPCPTYLLQGYAGTGKTTLVTTLVKTLPQIGMKYQLMAPTGRAAKVLSGYTGKTASTRHRKIYRFQAYADGSFRMTRAENKAKNTLFIVEAGTAPQQMYLGLHGLLLERLYVQVVGRQGERHILIQLVGQ